MGEETAGKPSGQLGLRTNAPDLCVLSLREGWPRPGRSESVSSASPKLTPMQLSVGDTARCHATAAVRLMRLSCCTDTLLLMEFKLLGVLDPKRLMICKRTSSLVRYSMWAGCG